MILRWKVWFSIGVRSVDLTPPRVTWAQLIGVTMPNSRRNGYVWLRNSGAHFT